MKTKLARCWFCGEWTRKYTYKHLTNYPWEGSALIVCNKCKRLKENEKE